MLDEQLNSARIGSAISQWYPGAVISVSDLRPHARLLDPEIPDYLLQLRQPTFVTINYRDFWKRHLAHPRYYLVCLKLEQNESDRVPDVLRQVLSLPEFRTKRLRMGKVISWSAETIKYFSV
ncbi:MAG: hypothetical protein ACRD82_22390 [Blastocatellia bacterium]